MNEVTVNNYYNCTLTAIPHLTPTTSLQHKNIYTCLEHWVECLMSSIFVRLSPCTSSTLLTCHCRLQLVQLVCIPRAVSQCQANAKRLHKRYRAIKQDTYKHTRTHGSHTLLARHMHTFQNAHMCTSHTRIKLHLRIPHVSTRSFWGRE